MKKNCMKSCGFCEPPQDPVKVAPTLSHPLSISVSSSYGSSGHSKPWTPKEGLMPAVLPGVKRPKFIMGMDVDYPPYTYLKQAPYNRRTDLDNVVGVGADMIKGMGKYCGFYVAVMQVHWSDCWNKGEIGAGLRE